MDQQDKSVDPDMIIQYYRYMINILIIIAILGVILPITQQSVLTNFLIVVTIAVSVGAGALWVVSKIRQRFTK